MSTRDRLIEALNKDLIGAHNPAVKRNTSAMPDLSLIVQNIEDFVYGDMSYSEIKEYLSNISRDVFSRGTTDGYSAYSNRCDVVKIAKEYVDEIILSTAGMITKSDYFKMLEQHDWFASMSDSNSVHFAGVSSRGKLYRLVEINPEFAPMLAAYQSYIGSIVSGNRITQPKLEDF